MSLLDRERKLLAAFKELDVDGSGSISTEELKTVLADPAGGNPMTEEQIDELIRQWDINGDGELQYEEFALMFSPMLEDEAVADADAEVVEGVDEVADLACSFTSEASKDTSPTSIQPAFKKAGEALAGRLNASSFTRHFNRSFRHSVARLSQQAATATGKGTAKPMARSAMRSAAKLYELSKQVLQQASELERSERLESEGVAAGGAPPLRAAGEPFEIRLGIALHEHALAAAAEAGDRLALADLIREWDLSGDGVLSLGELRVAIRNTLQVQATDADIKALLLRLDHDDSGTIDVEELKPALKQLQEAARHALSPEGRAEAEDAVKRRKAEAEERAAFYCECAASMGRVEAAERALHTAVAGLPMTARLGLALLHRRQKLDQLVKEWPGANCGYADLESVRNGFSKLNVQGEVGELELSVWYKRCFAEGLKRSVCRIGGGIHLKTDFQDLLKEGKAATKLESDLKAKVEAALGGARPLQQRLLLMEAAEVRRAAVAQARSEAQHKARLQRQAERQAERQAAATSTAMEAKNKKTRKTKGHQNERPKATAQRHHRQLTPERAADSRRPRSFAAAAGGGAEARGKESEIRRAARAPATAGASKVSQTVLFNPDDIDSE